MAGDIRVSYGGAVLLWAPTSDAGRRWARRHRAWIEANDAGPGAACPTVGGLRVVAAAREDGLLVVEGEEGDDG